MAKLEVRRQRAADVLRVDSGPEGRYSTAVREVRIERLTSAAELARFDVAPGFAAISSSANLRTVLADVFAAGGVVNAALRGSILVGYTADLPFLPIPFGGGQIIRRWQGLPDARELGGLEVARPFRGAAIAQRLLAGLVSDARLDRIILIGEALAWHWDADTGQQSIWEHRDDLLRLLERAGFRRWETDEAEIKYSPANFLFARIGPLTSDASRRAFEKALMTGGVPG
jgi:GNAT superfamily N-acetyltransferase